MTCISWASELLTQSQLVQPKAAFCAETRYCQKQSPSANCLPLVSTLFPVCLLLTCTLYHRFSTLPRQTSRHRSPSNLDRIPRDLKTALSTHRHLRPNIRKPFCNSYTVIQGFHTRRSTPRIGNHLRQAHFHQQAALTCRNLRTQASWVIVSYTSRHVTR